MDKLTDAAIEAAKDYLRGNGPWKDSEIGITEDDYLVRCFAKAIQAAEQRGMERAADICAHWAEKYAAASDSAKVAKKRIEARDFESMGMACRLREHDIRQAIRQGEQNG